MMLWPGGCSLTLPREKFSCWTWWFWSNPWRGSWLGQQSESAVTGPRALAEDHPAVRLAPSREQPRPAAGSQADLALTRFLKVLLSSSHFLWLNALSLHNSRQPQKLCPAVQKPCNCQGRSAGDAGSMDTSSWCSTAPALRQLPLVQERHTAVQ